MIYMPNMETQGEKDKEEMVSVVVTRGGQRWKLAYDGQWSKREGVEDEQLSKLLGEIGKGVIVRTVVVGEKIVGHGEKVVADVEDSDYMTGLRAALFEAGFKLEEESARINLVQD